LEVTREQAFPDQQDDVGLNAQLRGAVDFQFTLVPDGAEFNNSLAEQLVQDNLDAMDDQVVRFLDIASSQELISHP
jgi:hypothetical protein